MHANLLSAFRFHRRAQWARAIESSAWKRGPETRALAAIKTARVDVEVGRPRYAESTFPKHRGFGWDADRAGFAYAEKPADYGLREVGNVKADTPRGEVWANRDSCGWYTNDHGESFKDGTGLCWGVVFQLPGRNGKARFVAGYQFGGVDGGPTIDLGTVFEETAGPDAWNVEPKEIDAARDAARHADSLAQAAAEEEREWQSAYEAGSRWAEAGEEAAQARKNSLALLVETRAARKAGNLGAAMLSAVKEQVNGSLSIMCKARAIRTKLAQGEGYGRNSHGSFWTGDTRLQTAFCEAAGIEDFPG